MHIDCHHECKVLKMKIPGLCDICNEKIGDFESMRENGLSIDETRVARILSHPNNSVIDCDTFYICRSLCMYCCPCHLHM